MSIPRGAAGALALLLLAPTPGRPQQGSSLTLAAAVAAVRDHNPQIAAMLLASEAAGHRAEQAGKWSNPEITAYQETFPGAHPDIDQLIVTLSQRVPIGGQPGIASAAAAAGHEAARWDAEAVRAELTLRAQREYAAIYAGQGRVQAVQTALRASRALLRDMQLRNAEGDVSDFDVGRLRLDVQALEVRSAELETELRNASTRLATVTGLAPPEGGWGLLAPDAQAGGPPALGELEPDAGSPPEQASRPNRPEVLAETERERQADLQEKLARRRALPDLVLNAGYSRADPGHDGFVWSIQAALPLFDRNRDAAAAAAAEASMRRRRVEMLEREAWSQRRQARDAYDAATAALRSVQAERDGSLVDMARIAYEEGEVGVVTLLDTVRAELEATLRRIGLESRRNDGWFLWKWASGEALQEVTR